MQNIKLIIGSIIAALFIILGVVVCIQHNKIKNISNELSTAVINNKAYELENSELKNKSIEFEYTIEQLNYSKDSLTMKLNEARKQLNIKDKDIKQLQYIASTNYKVDTLRIPGDTIFVNNFQLDTVLKDDWSKLELNLAYPNTITAGYEFKNETTIVTSAVKETVDPPKKCWLARLFQKKHTVLTVDVIQENPYCTNNTERHIKVVD